VGRTQCRCTHRHPSPSRRGSANPGRTRALGQCWRMIPPQYRDILQQCPQQKPCETTPEGGQGELGALGQRPVDLLYAGPTRRGPRAPAPQRAATRRPWRRLQRRDRSADPSSRDARRRTTSSRAGGQAGRKTAPAAPPSAGVSARRAQVSSPVRSRFLVPRKSATEADKTASGANAVASVVGCTIVRTDFFSYGGPRHEMRALRGTLPSTVILYAYRVACCIQDHVRGQGVTKLGITPIRTLVVCIVLSRELKPFPHSFCPDGTKSPLSAKC
jgi:hypothetical protein